MTSWLFKDHTSPNFWSIAVALSPYFNPNKEREDVSAASSRIMRLLNVKTLKFKEERDFRAGIPDYVIASHRWVGGEAAEASYEDVQEKRNQEKDGYRKVKDFAKYIKSHIRGVKWLWIDTCCIDRRSSQEVTEAINSMFKWYERSAVCLAYLVDVERATDLGTFVRSEWFARGWTLQELLAPKTVVFLSRTWEVIGHKGEGAFMKPGIRLQTGPSLEGKIADRTSIPVEVLRDYSESQELSGEEKRQWITGRATTRPEDMSYCLFGILDVAIGANYGEGEEKAGRRLQEAIASNFDSSRLGQYLHALGTDGVHKSILEQRAPLTGTWILDIDQYKDWKCNAPTFSSKCLWLNGGPGTGKTFLCSAIIEDLKVLVKERPKLALVYYYFSFAQTPTRSTPYQSVLRSVIWQMINEARLHTPPELKILCTRQQQCSTEDLESFALQLLKQREQVFVVLDGLDECPRVSINGRPRPLNALLDCLQYLCKQAPQVSLLILSRPDLDMTVAMEAFHPVGLALDKVHTRGDISKYLDLKLAGEDNDNLKDLSPEMRITIKENLLRRADGMFQWVVCMISVTERILVPSNSNIIKALDDFPPDLEQTYQRMLIWDDETGTTKSTVKRALQWLAFSLDPLSVRMLYEAISFESDRHHWEEIEDENVTCLIRPVQRRLSALISTAATRESRRERLRIEYAKDKEFVSLSHASVKDYLLSGRAAYFDLGERESHLFLAQSCFDCMAYASKIFIDVATGQPKDLESSRLLTYALLNGVEHQRRAEHSSGDLADGIYQSLDSIVASARSCQAALSTDETDETNKLWEYFYGGAWLQYSSLPRLHLLCRLGLPCSVEKCLEEEPGTHLDETAVLEDRSGPFEVTALQCAVFSESSPTVKQILKWGADPDAAGGALFAAARSSNAEMTRMLLGKGANVNLRGPKNDETPLEIACWEGNYKVVQLLLEARASLTGSTALIKASRQGHQHVVRLLLDRDADVNARAPCEEEQTALQAAARGCHRPVVKMLLGAKTAKFGHEARQSALDIVRKEEQDLWEVCTPDSDEQYNMHSIRALLLDYGTMGRGANPGADGDQNVEEREGRDPDQRADSAGDAS